MKPICVSCQRFYRVKKIGFVFVEGMPAEGLSPAGAEADDRWADYKLWSGDLWRCEGCSHEIVSDVGQLPLREHYQLDFAATKERLGATFRVNDC